MRKGLAFALAISAVLAVSVSDEAQAQDRRATEIFETVQLCSGRETTAERIAAVTARGWRDETPSFLGRSMAEITGASQLRKRRDTALINSGVPGDSLPNCQFDFQEGDQDVVTALIAMLDSQNGAHVISSTGILNWETEADSYGLRRTSSNKLTIIWLPNVETEQD